jgi:hypothetical protein
MSIVRGRVAFLLAVFGFSVGASNAEVVVVVDPDDYEVGANLSSAVPGVTITYLRQDPQTSTTYNPTRSDVYAAPCTGYFCYYPDGLAFGSPSLTLEAENYHACLALGSYTPCFLRGFRAIELLFDSSTDYFEVRMDYWGLSPVAYAYDSNNELIADCTQWNPTCDRDTIHNPATTYTDIVSLRGDDRRVARVVVGGMLDWAVLQQFSFSETDPGRLLRYLSDELNSAGAGKNLIKKIELASVYYAAGDVQATCAVLIDFAQTVQSQSRGKRPKLSPALAAEITADTAYITNQLGCS